MKVLELRFKNLNSLYGEWIIDFTDPEYLSNGIFALTGPTGAGKSTILDAICLALYGATPRLRRINKSSNEIMSRQTGECYAEVLFESQAGRFCCHWEQRRARKKAGGALQDQEHQIADAVSGKPIETKKSLVVGVIEEKTGMDFDRFTRSILLAQGGFDTFLKADVEQKSKILEQITGTGIYSDISKRVHERQRDEREKMNLLKAETSGIEILSPELEIALQLELDTQQTQETVLIGQSSAIGSAITWLTSIDALKAEISSFTEEAANLQCDVAAFQPQREQLDSANKAAALAGGYATLTAIRQQQADDQVSLKAEASALPELAAAANTQAESLQSLELQALNAKAALKVAAPLIQKARSLDQQLAEQQKSISGNQESCEKDGQRLEVDKQLQLKTHQQRVAADKDLAQVNHYLQTHAQDEWLISGLAGVEEQLGSLLFRQQEIAQKAADIEQANTALEKTTSRFEQSTKQSSLRKQQLEAASKKLQQGQQAYSELLAGQLLREYRTEKETLQREMLFLTKIAELEDHRAKLADGESCPLCGAKEHPFAAGNIPVPDETEQRIAQLSALIGQAEDLEVANKKCEAAEADARKNLTDSEKLEASAANDQQAAEKNHRLLMDGLAQLQAGFAELKQTVSAKLQPLGITEIADDDAVSLLKSLKGRLSAWQHQLNKKLAVEKQLAEIDSEIKRLNALIEMQSSDLAEKQQHLDALKKQYATARDERVALYADKKPDDEERRLNTSVADAEAIEKSVRNLNVELQQKLTATKTHVAALTKRIEQREPELSTAQTDFSIVLEAAGFIDEKRFLEARLTTEQRTALSTQVKALDDKQADLKSRQKDRETRLNNELAKQVSDQSLDELQPQFKAYDASLKTLRDAIAGLKHKQSENVAAKARVQEKQRAIEAQKKESHRWENLHALIGSADGKKYRNFAQGLTFELMVAHANRQLEKMNDRYLLIRDDEKPLELNVVDNYQAGEIRSTKNLSGGESFIISLTLALGLSHMASQKVRVDSLFLDEGFGTLDEDALEIALETLSGLQQEGKLIGVISHVSALKERISTQLAIVPISGGRSRLVGPGCSRVMKDDV